MSLTLRCATLVCELKPELGSCIAGLWSNGISVVQSTAADQLESVRQSGSFPLVPYSNRIARALLNWHGQGYPLHKNWQLDPHSIHGVGWDRPWAVVSHDAASAQLVLRHPGDASWPFAFEATQNIARSVNSFHLNLGICNLEEYAASPGLDAPVADLQVDHCFDGWSGVVQLADDTLALRISSSLRHLVVYTLPSREDIAIEPVSHVNNAMGHWPGGNPDLAALGVVTLQPGAQFSCAMRIDIQHH